MKVGLFSGFSFIMDEYLERFFSEFVLEFGYIMG
jgi:hypothetical protein